MQKTKKPLIAATVADLIQARLFEKSCRVRDGYIRAIKKDEARKFIQEQMKELGLKPKPASIGAVARLLKKRFKDF